MKHLFANLRLATAAAREHLRDDPALFALQVSRRLPARIVSPVGRFLVRRVSPSSVWVPALLAGIASGGHMDVVRRLEAAVADDRRRTPDEACALADVALAANRPDLADSFLAAAVGARRQRAVEARRLWYSGALTAAVDVLKKSARNSDMRQGKRLAAELKILEGWRPSLAPVHFQPAPRRVLHVLTNSLPHTGSGYAQRSHSILLAQQQAGWDTLAVTRVGYPVQVGKLAARHRDVVDGVTYQRLLPPRRAAGMDGRLQQQAEELLAVALEFRPSILHTTTHYVNAIVTQAVAEAVGIPWVYEVRGQLADTWAATRGQAARKSERYRLMQEREAGAMQSADLVVTLGQAMKDNIAAAGVSEDSILLAPNAVGGQYLKEPLSTSEARCRIGLDPELRYIGTVSSLVDYEGVDDLIKAFELLAQHYPSLKLLIVGDGAALPGLKEQARTSGLAGRVIFTGRVPRSQAHLYHQALDVFVVPRKDLSVTRDVTPLKPVEAMASGRPVVASRLPALEEIVDDGMTGILVPAEDPAGLATALGSLLSDEGVQKRMGHSGRHNVLQTRTWKANVEACLEAYRFLGMNHTRRTS